MMAQSAKKENAVLPQERGSSLSTTAMQLAAAGQWVLRLDHVKQRPEKGLGVYIVFPPTMPSALPYCTIMAAKYAGFFITSSGWAHAHLPIALHLLEHGG